MMNTIYPQSTPQKLMLVSERGHEMLAITGSQNADLEAEEAELEKGLEKEMNLTLKKIREAEPALQIKFLRRLRSELPEKLEDFNMSKTRKSYFIHQANSLPEIDDLIELIGEINKKQLYELQESFHGNTSVDFLLLGEDKNGIGWTKHSKIF